MQVSVPVIDNLVTVDTTAIGIGTTVLYSILQPIANDTGIPLSTLNAGTGYSM